MFFSNGINLSKPIKKNGSLTFYAKILLGINNGLKSRKELVEFASGKEYRPSGYSTTFTALLKRDVITYYHASKSYMLTEKGQEFLSSIISK